MTRSKTEALRYLGLDLSLSPGAAVIEVRRRVPYLIAASSVATSTADPDAVRSLTVESFVAQMIYTYRPAPPLRFDLVLREDFTAGRNKRATQTIFAAWAAADMALHTYGYAVTECKPALSPSRVKSVVAGSGKAEKPVVAAAVRRILRLGDDHAFKAGYDDSDAAAVILAYLIAENLIDGGAA
jgi:crossover junction endodeoxyribonuclease RuvC